MPRFEEEPANQRILGRICLASSNFPRWKGDSTTPFVLHLAQDLIALGWQVHVIAPHAPGAARQEILDGVPVYRFRYAWPAAAETVCYHGGALINLRNRPFNWIKLPALVIFEWLALLRMTLRLRPDLINAHWIVPQGFVSVAVGLLTRVPVVITVHGGDVFALRGRTLSAFKRFALRRAAAVTVNSSATQAAVNELRPGRTPVHRVPMGADIAPVEAAAVTQIRASYRRGAGPLLLFVGRLVEEKGLGDLLRAVADLAKDLSDISLLAIGEGQDRKELEAQAQKLKLECRVTFLGWVDTSALSTYYAAADIFVGPSKRSPDGWIEAQGLTYAEAMLAGTPVIATRSGGILDVVQHEKTGLLVDEGRPDQIAAAVLRLHAETALARHMAKLGKRLAQSEFSRAGTATRFSELFGKTIAAAAS